MPNSGWRQRLHIDRRLLGLVGIGLLVVLGELALRGWDAHRLLSAELQKVRGRAAVLAASSDQIDWNARTLAVEAQREVLQKRLWQAPSEAQAQARLRDWLASALRSAEVSRPSVNLLPMLASGVASNTDGAALQASRARAVVSFELAPGTLEQALLQIEAGGQLARVDSLSVSARSRRVEMSVSVPVLLRAEATP